LLRQPANDELGNYQIISNHTIVVPADNWLLFSQQGTIESINYGKVTSVGAPKVKWGKDSIVSVNASNFLRPFCFLAIGILADWPWWDY
jgi:hypothetical protein